MNSPHITQLREQLLATLADLRNRDNPMEPDRARAVAQVATVLVETAKVEVDFLKVTGTDRSTFLDPHAPAALPAPKGEVTESNYVGGVVTRLPGVTQHRMGG